jgi:Arc/MetJ-type ribon-helix-helix transcriptional regulator
MGIVRVQLPDDLKRIIDRQIAEGYAVSEAEFLTEAARRYAAHLDAEGEIADMVQRADADVAGGRYTMVATAEDSQALHDATMARLRARMASDATGQCEATRRRNPRSLPKQSCGAHRRGSAVPHRFPKC